MRAIISAYPALGVPPEPTAIAGGVFVGTTANAVSLGVLKRLGVSYVLNCGGTRSDERYRSIRRYYPPESGMRGYEELALCEAEGADLLSLLDRAHALIDYALVRHGRLLVHCPGVSRSGAVALAYLVPQGTPLLEAFARLKQQRCCALTHEGFMRQLVQHARTRGALESAPHRNPAPRYFSRLNLHGIATAHLPL